MSLQYDRPYLKFCYHVCMAVCLMLLLGSAGSVLATEVHASAGSENRRNPSPAMGGDSIPEKGLSERPLRIGLDADMSGASALSGQAIRRGAELAIMEINAGGGVLGRPLQLVVKDHRGNPHRGLDNIEAFTQLPDLVAILGGIHTPVALYELPAIHQAKVPFLIPWAAGTSLVDNKEQPNYVFRISVRDEYAGGFLIDHGLRQGHRKFGLLLEQTGWGKSNYTAMRKALNAAGGELAAVEWFNWGTKSFSEKLLRLRQEGADVVMLVANPVEGRIVIEDMAALDATSQLPIISHWGITGGDLGSELTPHLDSVSLHFLQTFSFLKPPVPEKAQHLLASYRQKYGYEGPAEAIPAPVGIAHSYDLVHVLALAIDIAGTPDREQIRDALEKVPYYQGVMKHYQPPFSPVKHDALGVDSFIMAQFDERGLIIPVLPDE